MTTESIATPIHDVQNFKDDRNLAISRVGIKSLQYPVMIQTQSGAQPTVATFDMFVSLEAHQKGTHMSRFVELLEANQSPITIEHFQTLLQEMTNKLQSKDGYLNMSFPFFVKKAAPVSGVKSMMDYHVTLIGEWHEDAHSVSLKVMVPVTSLCPCSKAISEYGAHNQRSHITVTLILTPPTIIASPEGAKQSQADCFGAAPLAMTIEIEEIIQLVEAQASCELYGVLKRADEKYVTERAYDNPKFVEDLVRDIARLFKQDTRIQSFVVESENFESIHNHSAYARIEG